MSGGTFQVSPDLAAYAGAWRRDLTTPANWVVFDLVDSTQRRARTVLERHFEEAEEPQPFAMAALGQWSGIGRQGRPWASAAGLGIYATVASPVGDPERLSVVPLAVAVALAEVLEPLLGDALRLKWPNDLMVAGRKLGGILCEAVVRGRRPWVLVGFGINHGHRANSLPHPGATSLALSLRAEPPALAPLAARLVEATARCLTRLERAAEIVDRYRARVAHHPGDALFAESDGERVAGRFAGIDERGFLLLETDHGTIAVRSGEVSGR